MCIHTYFDCSSSSWLARLTEVFLAEVNSKQQLSNDCELQATQSGTAVEWNVSLSPPLVVALLLERCVSRLVDAKEDTPFPLPPSVGKPTHPRQTLPIDDLGAKMVIR